MFFTHGLPHPVILNVRYISIIINNNIPDFEIDTGLDGYTMHKQAIYPRSWTAHGLIIL